MSSQDVSVQVAEDLGINQKLYNNIVKLLKRPPNFLELQIYSVMWSENISYKSSVRVINSLPNRGEAIIVGAGEANAGVVDLGNGLCCVFKMGTHNHPSGIDPYQGAATCVGDICRDVLTLGARPILVLDSLRFGEAWMDRTHWLMEGVMSGIKEYCRLLDISYMGGEISFQSSYDTNPIVNVMVAGLVTRDKLLWGRSTEVGQRIYIVGSPTGKDGVNGSGDNFTIPQYNSEVAKGLMDSILQLNDENLLVRAENMDMAGIVSACANLGVYSNKGVVVDLDTIPLSQQGMLDEEILFSRTQERMLILVDKRDVSRVEAVLRENKMMNACIGRLDEGHNLRFMHGDSCVAQLPAYDLVMGFGAPQESPPYQETPIWSENVNLGAVAEPDDYWKVINIMVRNSNVVIKEYLQISLEGEGLNSPSDARIVSPDDCKELLCFGISGNSRYVAGNPRVGSQINVAKAIRQIVCSGGNPLALNDCLNFGSVFDRNVFAQFLDSVDGLIQSSNFFNVPVAGGNVSFFNESSVNGKRHPIYPTPVVSILGLINSKENHMSYIFRNKGDMIFMIGRSRNDIAGSEYLCSIHNIDQSGVPYFDLGQELELNHTVCSLIERKLISSAHSVGRGGLFFNLLESSMPLCWGFDITSPAEVRTDAFLFGEAQGRVVVSVSRQQEDAFVDFMMEVGHPFSTLGHVTKGELRIDDISYGFVEEYKEKYRQASVLE